MSSEMAIRLDLRIDELRKEIALIEGVKAPCNEPALRILRAQLAELEALRAADPHWRSKIRARAVREAIRDYGRKVKPRGGRL